MAMTEAEKNVATGETFPVIDGPLLMRVSATDIWEIVTENQRLRAKVDELQARDSALVFKMQGMNPYGDRDNRQRTVLDWAKRTFGASTQTLEERILRLVEEAIEVAHAVVHIDRETIVKLLDRTYSKDVSGSLRGEVTDVALCLLAVAESVGFSLSELEAEGIERLFSKDSFYFVERQAKKASNGIGTMPSTWIGAAAVEAKP